MPRSILPRSSSFVLPVILAVFFSADASAEWCTDPDNPDGPRACDEVYHTSGCAQVRPLSGAPEGAWVADFNTLEETQAYLANLDALDDSIYDYMSLIPLGTSWGMGLSIDQPAGGLLVDAPLIAVRVTSDASDLEQREPAILLVCGVHAHEWLPQEVCLGLVDYYVKAANGEAPYSGDQTEIQNLLANQEIWFVVNANPAGRMRDDIGTDHGAIQEGTYRQRKNRQWDPDLDCVADWDDHASAGRSGEDFRYGQTWDYPGINLGTAFSAGWGDQSDHTFGRNLIAKLPSLYDLAPEQYECTDDADCTTTFNRYTYPHCLTYLDGVTSHKGCFVLPAFDDDGYGLEDCESALETLQFPPSEWVTSHTVCLRTQVSDTPTYKYFAWECGRSGHLREAIEDDQGRPLSISPPNPDNPDLLQYCYHGILQSCSTDNDCSTTPIGPEDYDVLVNGKWKPHYIPQGQMDGQLYCASKGGPEGYHHCAVSGNRSCGSEKYSGSTPFEAIEARLIRELVNNYSFSIFVDVHSNRNDFQAICNDLGSDGKCVKRTESKSTDNLFNIQLEAARDRYHNAAEGHWTEIYDDMADPAFPDWIDLVAKGVADPKIGTPPAWPAGKAEVQGSQSSPTTSTIWNATRYNFDLHTRRFLPSFQWETGALKPSKLAGDPLILWNSLMKCEEGEDMGGKPKSRMMVENQLVGARALVNFLTEQAKIPNVGHDNGVNFIPGRSDVAVQSLRIHDSVGRGVQQTETRWEEAAGDSEALIVVPAGRWHVSFDYMAGGDPGDSIDARLTLEAIDISPAASAPPTVLLSETEGYRGGLQPGERAAITRLMDFEAGKIYEIVAHNKEPLAEHNDDLANDALVSKVKVLDCQEGELQALIPNGLDRDAFCEKGLPASNPDFECWDSKGTCRECWISQTEDKSCEAGSFCSTGICDTQAACLSSNLEDAYEGDPESVPWAYGPGTHIWTRTLRRDEGVQDIDEAWFTGHPLWEEPFTPDQGGTYNLEIRVRDHCWAPPGGDAEMTQLELYVDQQVSVGVFKDLYNWAPGNGSDGWQVPRADSGYGLTLTYEEVVGIMNDQPLRVRVRNEGTSRPSVTYSLYVTLEYAGLETGEDAYSAPSGWLIGPQDVLSLDGDGYSAPIFEFQVADEQLASGELVYFSPGESPTMALTTAFIAVDSRGNVTGSQPLGDGRAIDLGGLDPVFAPYKVKLQNGEEAIDGRLYYCSHGVDCEQFDPRRGRCCSGGTGPESLCCTDEYGSSSCVNVMEDETNCGGCGLECETGELCLDGLCAVSDGTACAQTVCPGETWCCMESGEPTCRALLLDDENCGWCGDGCAWYGGCLDGYCGVKDSEQCEYTCSGGATCCWWQGWEECVDTNNDPYFCGDCHTVCDSTSECVGGKCAPWWEVSDPCYSNERNCGQPGQVQCRDVMYDESNCGACGNECSGGSDCVDGVCTANINHYEPWEIQ